MSYNEETYPVEDGSWLQYLWMKPAVANLIEALRYEFGLTKLKGLYRGIRRSFARRLTSCEK